MIDSNIILILIAGVLVYYFLVQNDEKNKASKTDPPPEIFPDQNSAASSSATSSVETSATPSAETSGVKENVEEKPIWHVECPPVDLLDGKIVQVRLGDQGDGLSQLYLKHDVEYLSWTDVDNESTLWDVKLCPNGKHFALFPKGSAMQLWCEQSIFTARNCWTNAMDSMEDLCAGDGALVLLELHSENQKCFLRFKKKEHDWAYIGVPNHEGGRVNVTNWGIERPKANLEIKIWTP